jgi:hypothetical protein
MSPGRGRIVPRPDASGKRSRGRAGSEDHAIDILGALDLPEPGEQLTALTTIAPIGPAELGHELEVLIDQLVHAAAQQLCDRLTGAR